MGPFMGHMILVLVDSHSKWIEAHVMSSVTSTLTIQCLRRIFATFGLPEVVVTDNGPSLVSDEFEAWLKRNGIRHKTSPPYHPATNGLAERAVQTVKRGVKKMKSGTLSDKIARFLFAYRNTPHSTTGTTPAELLMGHKLRSPLDLLKPDLHIRVEEKARETETIPRQDRPPTFICSWRFGIHQEFLTEFNWSVDSRGGYFYYRSKIISSNSSRWTHLETSYWSYSDQDCTTFTEGIWVGRTVFSSWRWSTVSQEIVLDWSWHGFTYCSSRGISFT